MMYVDDKENYYVVSDFQDIDGELKTAIYASDEHGEIVDLCETMLTVDIDTPEIEEEYMRTAYNAKPFDDEASAA